MNVSPFGPGGIVPALVLLVLTLIGSPPALRQLLAPLQGDGGSFLTTIR